MVPQWRLRNFGRLFSSRHVSMPPLVAVGGIALLAYLLGGFPTALLLGRLFFGVDIREHGSGNVGSTNALRVFGWQWGIVVQIVDILKGVVAVALLPVLLPLTGEGAETARVLAGVAAVAGHCWSPWAGFRGGKGVNTAAGVLAVLAPVELLFGIGGFTLALLSSGYVSVGSLTAALVVPPALLLRLGSAAGQSPVFWGALALAAIVIVRHRANLKRLLQGREHRFDAVWLLGRLRRKQNSMLQ